MSSIAGYSFPGPSPEGLLDRMRTVIDHDGSICASEASPLQGWGLCAVSPKPVGELERIAVTEDRQVAAVMAGYLYGGDAEAEKQPGLYCLRRYLDEGTQFIKKLNGSFVIAIIDRRSDTVVLAADPHNSRPLYYWIGNGVLFSSSVRAIRQHPRALSKLIPDRLREFLMVRMLLRPGTYYEGIEQVAGGCIVTIRSGQAREERYWPPGPVHHVKESLDDAAHRTAEAMRQATEVTCPAGKRTLLMLSGGIDSRFIACLLPRPTLCTTLQMEAAREVKLAQQVAGALGHSHVFVQVPETYPLTHLEEGTRIGEAYDGFQHAHGEPIRQLCEEHRIEVAASGCKLGVWFREPRSMLRKLHVGRRNVALPLILPAHKTAFEDALWAEHGAGYLDKLAPLFIGTTADELWEYLTYQARASEQTVAPYTEYLYDRVTLARMTESCLLRCHLNAASLGSFAQEGIPVFDRNLGQTALSILPQYRLKGRAFRRALAIVNPEVARIPWSATGAPADANDWWALAYYVGRQSVRRIFDALGSSAGPAPIEPFPRAAAALRTEYGRELLRSRAADSPLYDLGILRPAALTQAIEDHIDRRFHYGVFLYLWLTLDEWLRKYH